MPSPDECSGVPARKVVILGTGGTIAGRAATVSDNVGYRAGAMAVEDLVRAVPPLHGLGLETERVAQLDSKDMDHACWQALARRCRHHLARDEVCAVIVTHGTDTLEETAWFLQRVLAPAKPLVLTAAMRPATSLAADGPQNLLDAVTLARSDGARGVLVAMAGVVHGAQDVQKMHGWRVDAFASPNDGAIAFVEEGRVRRVRDWPSGTPLPPALLDTELQGWPWVVLVTSHAGIDARQVQALIGAGAEGLVIAGTGNATVHAALAPELRRAAAAGVELRRASRCACGTPVAGVPAVSGAGEGQAEAAPLAFYPQLNAVKSRVELMLELMLRRLPDGPGLAPTPTVSPWP
jgi:L-asparaginase